MSFQRYRIVDGDAARCFNVIDEPKDGKFGEECGRILMRSVDGKPMSGEVICHRHYCKAKYHISDGKVKMVARWDRGKKQYINLTQGD